MVNDKHKRMIYAKPTCQKLIIDSVKEYIINELFHFLRNKL